MFKHVAARQLEAGDGLISREHGPVMVMSAVSDAMHTWVVFVTRRGTVAVTYPLETQLTVYRLLD